MTTETDYHPGSCQDPECNRMVTVCKSCKMAACWRGMSRHRLGKFTTPKSAL